MSNSYGGTYNVTGEIQVIIILFTACVSDKTDLVFLLDSSTSVSGTNFELMKEFVADIVNNADIDTGHVRVGMLVYSTDVSIQFHLRRFTKKVEVLDAISRTPYRPGDTNTAGALRALWSQMFTSYYGDRTDAQNIAILVTDGISNINSYRTEIEANTAKSRAVHMYAVGIGLEDTRELEAIASDPISQNMFYVDDFEGLRQLIGEGVLRKVCLGILT